MRCCAKQPYDGQARLCVFAKGAVLMGLMLTGVSKSFGSFQAINELSLEVREGALFGFLGANGAGKTTTMRMILDLFRPDSGQITWNGSEVRQVPRRSFGYL